MTEEKKRYGADAIVDSLANHDVKYVFGVPGAKLDRLFERLDHPVNPKAPKLIVTRHEQNASFIAGGIGRLTGTPGVVLTTSGPGVSNSATGLVTATAEGDPVLAISGQVPRRDLKRLTHQSMAGRAGAGGAPPAGRRGPGAAPKSKTRITFPKSWPTPTKKLSHQSRGRPLFRYRKTSPTGKSLPPR